MVLKGLESYFMYDAIPSIAIEDINGRSGNGGRIACLPSIVHNNVNLAISEVCCLLDKSLQVFSI